MTTEPFAPWTRVVPGILGMLTAKDLALLPDDVPGRELVDGRLVQSMPTGGGHGWLALRLAHVILLFVDVQGLGAVLPPETGFDLSGSGQPNTVLAPDVAFVRADRMPSRASATWDAYWPLAPDLAVEIASPTQYRPELAAKAHRWLAAGVRLLWVVWPSTRQIDVWRPGAPVATLGLADTLDGLDVLPGFTYPIARLFN